MKRYLIIGTSITGLILASLAYHLYSTLTFKGNQSITIIDPNKPYTNLKALLANKEFQNKVVYVDMWGTHCGPCIKEFKHIASLKERFRDKPVSFLYIATTYEKTDDRYQWKKFINKYHLEGSNVFAELPLFNDTWSTLESKEQNRYMIPRHFIVSRKGRIINNNAYGPSNGHLLYQQIDSALALTD